MKPRCVRTRASLASAVLLAAAAATARPNNPAAPPPNAVLASIPTFHDDGKGATSFHVGPLTGKTAPAWRDNTDLIDKQGVIPAPGAGYMLMTSVVIRVADAARPPVALVNAVTAAGATLTPTPNTPGFLTADSPAATWSVQSAIDLTRALRAIPDVLEAYLDIAVPLEPRTLPTDPLFPQQWHLHNTQNALFDVNAEPAWTAGYTGAGVVIGIVDRGWAITHPDLAAAYNADASQDGAATDSHGTACAGVCGARANNSEGCASIAYDCQMGKLYYGSSSVIAAAFAFRNDLIHIKSNSWGPAGDGRIRTMPSNERTALQNAAANGRAGLGEIFVWAGGNGYLTGNDRVDYDPYASNRYVIAVGAIDSLDRRSTYSEPGASLSVVSQSDYDLNTTADAGITTTTSPSGYINTFGGTSSACPLAAGAIALMLQANPALSRRDVQHVLIRSARRCDVSSATWTTNAAGLHVSHDYGFGAVDAGAATALAATWRPVAREITDASAVLAVATPIPNNNPAGVSSSYESTNTMLLEHVEVIVSITHTSVGDLRLTLTSPAGTRSVLATPRFDSTDNYTNYVFTTVRHWGERAAGSWTLAVADETPSESGTWVNWRLNFYGTCAADYNRDASVNSQDFFDFLTAFFADDPSADFNADGVVNSQDFCDFLTAFFTGC